MLFLCSKIFLGSIQDSTTLPCFSTCSLPFFHLQILKVLFQLILNILIINPHWHYYSFFHLFFLHLTLFAFLVEEHVFYFAYSHSTPYRNFHINGNSVSVIFLLLWQWFSTERGGGWNEWFVPWETSVTSAENLAITRWEGVLLLALSG